MRNYSPTTSTNDKLSKRKVNIAKIQQEAKQRLFNLLYVLLKDIKTNLWFELICIVFQGIQLLAFPLHPVFASVWKSSTFYQNISHTLQITLMIFESKDIYFIFFAFALAFVIFLYIIIIYLTISLSHTNNHCIELLWIFLKSSLGLIIGTCYLPIMNTFIYAMNCINADDNSDNTSIELIECWSTQFYIFTVIGLIAAVLFFFFCLFFSVTYIETRFANENPLAKSTTYHDVCLLVIKTALVFCNQFLTNEELSQFMIILIVISSGYIAFAFYNKKPHYNTSISKTYTCICYIFFWSGLVLVIGQLLKATHYNGSLGLFFIGIPFIILILCFNREDILFKLLSSISNMQQRDKYFDQIKIFLKLVNGRNSNRKTMIQLKGYIIQCEEKCILHDCPLKKYLAALAHHDNDALIFLLQHAEGMYQNALTKFPSFVSLRCSYGFFLLEQMNKKRQAAFELDHAEKYTSTIEEQFVIFRYKKFIEEHLFEFDGTSSASASASLSYSFKNQIDVVSNFAYKNYLKVFKVAITKASGLYIDFWSLLLTRDPDNHDDLTKLNDYGTDINAAVENIHACFSKLQKIKINDQEVIKYYSDFLNDILNDKEKALEYSARFNSCNEEEKEAYEEFNPITNDLTALNTNDEYQYIIASAQTDKIGIITNISLGICNIFGYSKHELVGKAIDMIMPDIFHKEHKEVLMRKLNEFKKKSVELNEELKDTKPIYRELETFGKNKSRYLIPLSLKTAFVATENNDLIFIAKLWKDQTLLTLYSPQQGCFILTNNSFIIQSFTVNAVSLLNMNSNAINGNVDITDFIKQFNEEFLFYMSENEHITQEQRALMKKTIVSHKFKNPSLINWRHTENTSEYRRQVSRIFDSVTDVNANDNANNTNTNNNNLYDSGLSIKKISRSKEDVFILSMTETLINNKQVGYLFRFDLYNEVINKVNSKYRQSIAANKHFTSFLNANGSDHKKRHTTYGYSFINPEREREGIAEEDIFNRVVKIDKEFIPEQKKAIHFDPKNYSFKFNPTTSIELKDHLRKESIKKIQKQTNIQFDNDDDDDSDSDLSSSSYNTSDIQNIHNDEDNDVDEDDSGMEYSRSSSNSNKPKKNCNIKQTPNKTKRITSTPQGINKKSDDVYYKVNMEYIKYSIYDYNKLMIIEIKDYDKTDQVQLKMSKHPFEDNNASSPHIKSNTNHDITSSSIFDKPASNSTRLLNDKEISDQKKKEASLIKKIEFALGKEENQPAITRMKIICLIVFITLLLFIAGTLAILLSSIIIVKENILLIQKSFDLLRNNALGIYYVRELTLVNNPNYTSLPNQRHEYIPHLFNETQKLFNASNDLINDIITSSLKLSLNTSLLVYNHTFYSAIIDRETEDFGLKFFNLSCVSTFLETNTALFYIGHTNLNNIIPTKKDVFYYLFNSLNGAPIELKDQGYALLNELNHNIKLIIRNVFLFWCFKLLALIGIYFILAKGYNGISKRKESYLEVFFEIGSNVIQSSLDKCEHFIKKIQIDSLNINDDLSLDNYPSESKGNNRTSNNNNKSSGNSNNDISRNMKSHKGSTSNRTNRKKSSKEAKIIKTKFAVLLIANGLVTLISFWFFILFIKKALIVIKVYSYMTEQHNKYLMLFNGLREFMFDSNAVVNWKGAKENIEEVLSGLYYYNNAENKFIIDNLDSTPKIFAETYRKVYKEAACEYTNNNTYSSLHQCELIMSTSTILGLQVALVYLLEDIRTAKNFAIEFKMNQTKTNMKYNLTLTGTPQGDKLWPVDDAEKIAEYKKHDSINQFLYSNLHLDINILYILVLIPNFNMLSLLLKNNYKMSIQTLELVYFAGFCVFIGIIVGIYLLLWLPYEKKINQTIFKTKNMLSIIPKEALASLSNIHRILNISKVTPIKSQIINEAK